MKFPVLILSVLVISLALYALWYRQSHQEKRSTIIILNGPSAAGKSSVQKEFMSLADKPWLKIGIDNFFVGVIPEKWIFNPPVTVDFIMKGIRSTDQAGNPVFALEIGPAGDRIIYGMHRAIEGYADAGNNIIVDYIAYKPSWLPALLKRLKHHKVILVGVTAPLEIIEEHEKKRATSPVGHARSHYESVHAGNAYDLMIDTSKTSALEAAQKINEIVS